jgi:hypothetical protein
LYPFLFLFHISVPMAFTLYLQGNPFFSAATMVVYIIEFLKLISYAHVNYWCRCARDAAEHGKVPNAVSSVR